MRNVAISVKGTIATITIDLSKTYGPSSTGKSIIVASTQGTKSIPGTEVKLGINAYLASDSPMPV